MAPDHEDDMCVTVHLPFDRTSVRRARHLLAGDLRQTGVRASVVDDAQLVLSELLTNGLQHGQAHPDRTIQVSWCLRQECLWLSVVDGGDVDELQTVQLNDHALSGRGLAIVDHLCENWTVERHDGTRVTAELAYA